MRPLEGLRVVDLTRVLSGPYCTMQLGDLGAEVIKVEQPGKGDDTRAFAPPYQGDQAAYFLSVNRNKKSVTLDMKSEAGKEVLGRLIDVSDVLVENFRPGAMDRLGFGFAAVHARRPSLVYCSISGFRRHGTAERPARLRRDRAGRSRGDGPDGAARRGAAQGRHRHCRSRVGPHRLAGYLGRALRGQAHRAQGQHVSISMYEVVAALLTFNASIYFATGQSPRRRGNEHPTIVPYETFEASDGWINLGVANDDLWQRFCKGAERPDLADDPRFARASDRVRNRDALVPLVRALIKAAQRAMIGWAHGQGRRAERRHPHRRRGLRQRAAQSARHDRGRCRIPAPAP